MVRRPGLSGASCRTPECAHWGRISARRSELTDEHDRCVPLAVKVAPGDEVSPGQSLIVLEAMKMENELSAEQAGKVATVHVTDGATVESGELLVELE